MNSHIIHVTYKDMADARNSDTAFPAANAIGFAINRIAGLHVNTGYPDIGSSYVYFRKGSWDYYFRTIDVKLTDPSTHFKKGLLDGG